MTYNIYSSLREESEEKKVETEILNYAIQNNEGVNPKFISDGYHSFLELYQFRMLYNALLFNTWHKNNEYTVLKSWRHDDGELCFGGGHFIVQAELPTGQISNHYSEQYWELFNIPEKEFANKWDGHDAGDVLERMMFLLDRE